MVYRNGYIYTVDAKDSVQQALAVRDGRIVYVGDNEGVNALTGKKTRVVDLGGRMLMPGLVDAHMHPQSGGSRMLHCNLNYESLTVAQFQARIQTCLDKDTKTGPDAWLWVVNWFQQGLLPEGVETTAATLDVIKTRRPIVVRSSYGHSVLLNSRGIEVAKITDATPNPPGGVITRDAQGHATGLLEDAAQDLAMDLLPPLTPAQNLQAARSAMAAMQRQGITTFFDVYTDPETLTAYRQLHREGEMTARGHFAVLIDLDKTNLDKAMAEVLRLRQAFDQGPTQTAPAMQVRHAKLFMDGVIAAPAFTGAMLEPYFINHGSHDHPQWRPGQHKGPPSYFSPSDLRDTLRALAREGIDPHVHVDGDRAVRDTLDAIAELRTTPEGKDMRPGLAHAEIVHPHDFHRFAEVDATPVLSFQWGKPAPDTVGGLRDYMGPQRYAVIEPQALLLNAGARVAFGSDWPVDPLDEWHALQVGVTRTAGPYATKGYTGTLTDQPGMPRSAVLRAITMNAAYVVRQEKLVGSLEVGKLADLIMLDRNFFSIPAEDIANIRVLQTMVGGKIVYQAKGVQ